MNQRVYLVKLYFFNFNFPRKRGLLWYGFQFHSTRAQLGLQFPAILLSSSLLLLELFWHICSVLLLCKLEFIQLHRIEEPHHRANIHDFLSELQPNISRHSGLFYYYIAVPALPLTCGVLSRFIGA